MPPAGRRGEGLTTAALLRSRPTVEGTYRRLVGRGGRQPDSELPCEQSPALQTGGGPRTLVRSDRRVRHRRRSAERNPGPPGGAEPTRHPSSPASRCRQRRRQPQRRGQERRRPETPHPSIRLRSPMPHPPEILDRSRARSVPGPRPSPVRPGGGLGRSRSVGGPHWMRTCPGEVERSGEPGKGPAGERETVSNSRRRRQPERRLGHVRERLRRRRSHPR